MLPASNNALLGVYVNLLRQISTKYVNIQRLPGSNALYAKFRKEGHQPISLGILQKKKTCRKNEKDLLPQMPFIWGGFVENKKKNANPILVRSHINPSN